MKPGALKASQEGEKKVQEANVSLAAAKETSMNAKKEGRQHHNSTAHRGLYWAVIHGYLLNQSEASAVIPTPQ